MPSTLDDTPDAQNSAQAGLAVPALVLADGLSYEDYFRQINKMAEQMRARWQREEKVGALKVAIQLSKLLADASQLKLYAKKYSRIVEILDEFGRYVYERVHSLAAEPGTSGTSGTSGARHKNDDLTPLEQRADFAKDIYRNWQYKILSIRELVPRFYTELAILRASDILFDPPPPPPQDNNSKYNGSKSTLRTPIEEQFLAQTLKRLSNYCAGLGDPIVCVHARAYLCKVAGQLIDWTRAPGETTLFNLVSLNARACALVACRLEPARIQAADTNLFFELLTSAFQSILNVVSVRYNLNHDEDARFAAAAREHLSGLLDDILALVARESPGSLGRNLILNTLFVSLPNDITSAHAHRLMAELERGSNDHREHQAESGPREQLIPSTYTTLANFLIALDGSETSSGLDRELEADVVALSEEVLARLLSQQGARVTSSYLKCSKALLTFASRHAPGSLDRLLASLVRRLTHGRQHVSHCASIMDIIKTLFTQQQSVELDELRAVMVLRSFNQLYDSLRKDEHRLDVAKYILEMLRSCIKLNCNSTTTTTTTSTTTSGAIAITDRPTINFLLKLFGTVNECLSPLAAQEDLRHLSEVVVFFIDLVKFEDVLELVEFYSRCRSNLGNLNLALRFLIDRVLELPAAHRQRERRRGARRNVLNCCLAFAFTTLPAIQDEEMRVSGYMAGCRLALTRKSFSLADYFMRQIMVSLLGTVESGYAQGSCAAMDERAKRRASALLELMIKHQDYIDLQHKLALSQLVRVSFKECSDLLASLSNLKCADDGTEEMTH